jgi:hypothetical protein
MKNRTYWIGFVGIMAAGLAVRLASLPPIGFYDDVPLALRALELKDNAWGFPGYAPYNLLVGHLAGPHVSYFQVMVILSLIMAMSSVVYVMLAARAAGGDLISWGAGATLSLGVFPLYYSLVGTTYVSDTLCVSAMLYHGWEFFRSRRPAQYYWTLAWYCFGVIVRPVSAGCTFLGLAVLLFFWKSRAAIFATLVAVMLTCAIYVGISASTPFFGSVAGFIRGAVLYKTTLHQTFDRRHILTNLFRFFCSPVYGEQIWLVFGLVVAVKYWQNRRKWEFLLLVSLAVPYLLVISRYIAHAGYYCLLLPIFALLPLCFLSREGRAAGRLVAGVSAAFVLVALGQWFVIRPIDVTNVPAAVVDSYFFQYCRDGVRTARADTLSELLFRNGIGLDSVPPERLHEVQNNMWLVPTNRPAAKDSIGWP